MSETSKLVIKIMIVYKIPFSFETIEMMEKDIEKTFESNEY